MMIESSKHEIIHAAVRNGNGGSVGTVISLTEGALLEIQRADLSIREIPLNTAAAAPELLEALKRIAEDVDNETCERCDWLLEESLVIARAAIAKAEGAQ